MRLIKSSLFLFLKVTNISYMFITRKKKISIMSFKTTVSQGDIYKLMSLGWGMGLVPKLTELYCKATIKGGKYRYILMYLFETGNCQKPLSEPGVPISMVSHRSHCLNVKFWNKNKEQLRKCILFRVLASVYTINHKAIV